MLQHIRLVDFSIQDDKKHEELHINMFGVDTDGCTYSLCVYDYNPFFYVKVPSEWTNANDLVAYIRCLMENEDDLLHGKLQRSKTLYWFDNNTLHNFVILTFACMRGYYDARLLWYSDDTIVPLKYEDLNLELYEQHVPPLLRFFHIHDHARTRTLQSESQVRDVS